MSYHHTGQYGGRNTYSMQTPARAEINHWIDMANEYNKEHGYEGVPEEHMALRITKPKCESCGKHLEKHEHAMIRAVHKAIRSHPHYSHNPIYSHKRLRSLCESCGHYHTWRQHVSHGFHKHRPL